MRVKAGMTSARSGLSDPGSAMSPSAEKSDSDSERDREVRAAVSGVAGFRGVHGLAWVVVMWRS